MIEACKEISKDPGIGKNYDKLSIEIFGFSVGKHIIFYRNLETKDVEVVRILHESMNVKNRLNEGRT